MKFYVFIAVVAVMQLALVSESQSRTIWNRWRRTLEQPTTRPPTGDQQVEEVSCGYAYESVFGSRVLVITCSSSTSDVTRISYFVNGIPIGIRVGNEVRLSSSQLRQGANTIDLTVYTSSGSSSTISLPVDTSTSSPSTQPLPTTAATTNPPPTTTMATTQPTVPPTQAPPTNRQCRYECRGILSSNELTITCDVDRRTDEIVSIEYDVNGGSLQNAGSVSSFSIPTRQFRDGVNRVNVRVTHSVCGAGVMQLEFQYQRPTSVQRCLYECGGTLSQTDFTVTCTVNGREDSRSTIAYRVNGGASVNANSAPTFIVPSDDLQLGENRVDITMSHPDCSQPGSLELEFTYQQRPQQQPSPPDISCSVGQENTNVVFTCSSTASLTITTIVYYVNGVLAGFSAGGVAQIDETFFRDGINDVRLVVTKADQSTQEITMTLSIDRELPSGPSTPGCLYNCSGTLRGELTITCNVNGREDSQSSISYQVNGGASVNAISIPTFSIPTSQFRNGDNVVEISIIHSDCSVPGSIRLEFPYQEPPTLSPTSPPSTTTPSPPPSASTPTLPPSLPPVFCSLNRQEGNIVFNCSGHSSSSFITMISAFVNGVPVISTSLYPLGLKICQLLPDIVAFWLIMDDAPLNNNSLTVGRVLRISELQLREGMNDVMLTVMRSDGTSQDINYSVNIEREEVTLPPVVCEVNCSYRLVRNEFVFTCAVSGDSANLLSISYSLNEQTALVSTSSSFSIPQTQFLTGENTLTLSILIICNGDIRTFQRDLRVSIQSLPPPATLPPSLEAFRVQVSGISPSNYATLVPSFPLSATFTVDEAGEYLVIRVTGTGTQRVLVLLYSLNGARDSYEIGDTVRIHKDQLREGENTVTLTAISSLRQTVLINSTLEVTKVGGATPPAPTPLPAVVCDVHCNVTYEGNAIRVVCHESSDIASITYQINGDGNYTVRGSECVIDGDLLTREVNNVAISVNCHSGGVSISRHQLVQPLTLRCQSVSEEEDGVRISCNSNRESSVLTKQCYIDGTLLQNCDMSNLLSYSMLSGGQRTFEMEVTDDNSLTATSQISFLFKFQICCQGIYNSIDDVIHVSCDSNRPIVSSQYRINNGPPTQRSLPFDVAISDCDHGANIQLHVEAQDRYGNEDSSDLTFSC